MPLGVAAQSCLAAAARLAEVSSVRALPQPVLGTCSSWLHLCPVACGHTHEVGIWQASSQEQAEWALLEQLQGSPVTPHSGTSG